MRSAKRHPRRIRRTVALAAIGAAALLAGPFAAKSNAGIYTSTDCASWHGGYSTAQYSQSHAMAVVTQDCGNGGNGLGFAVPTSGWSGPQSGASWIVNTPEGTHF